MLASLITTTLFSKVGKGTVARIVVYVLAPQHMSKATNQCWRACVTVSNIDEVRQSMSTVQKSGLAGSHAEALVGAHSPVREISRSNDARLGDKIADKARLASSVLSMLPSPHDRLLWRRRSVDRATGARVSLN